MHARIVTVSLLLFTEYPLMLFWVDFPLYNTQEKDELEHVSKDDFRESIGYSIFLIQSLLLFFIFLHGV